MFGVASRALLSGSRSGALRAFHSSPRRLADEAPLPAQKPMGAARGGFIGFMLGCVMSGGAVYSFVMREYTAANDLLTEDIYTLQASVTRLTNYVKTLEEKMQSKK